MVKREELNDIGGWLLFFIITLVIISPLYNLSIIFSQFDAYTLVEIFESLASVSLFILAGIFLWVKMPYAVKFAKVFLVTTLVINVIYAIVFSDFSDLIQGTVYYLIWIMYLNKSERVKIVYGRLKEKKKGMQVWPILSIIYAFVSPTFGIIFSIISLRNISRNHKLKGLGLSIVALITGIVIFMVVIGYSALIGASFDYVPEEIEASCLDYCNNTPDATEYFMEYNTAEQGYICYCLNDYSDILGQKIYPHILE